MKTWMKRFDLVIACALTLLGAFVTREALATRSRAGAERTASFGIARVDTSAAATDSVVLPRRPSSPVSSPTSTADVRQRIELQALRTTRHSHAGRIGRVIRSVSGFNRPRSWTDSTRRMSPS